MTADAVLIRESHSDSELAAETNDKKASSPKRSETFGGFDRRPSQKTTRRAPTTIPEGKLEENHVARRDSGLSLASKYCCVLDLRQVGLVCRSGLSSPKKVFRISTRR